MSFKLNTQINLISKEPKYQNKQNRAKKWVVQESPDLNYESSSKQNSDLPQNNQLKQEQSEYKQSKN